MYFTFADLRVFDPFKSAGKCIPSALICVHSIRANLLENVPAPLISLYSI